MDERENRRMVFDTLYKLESDRVRTREKTVEELKEANAGLAEEVARLEKENTRYRCVIEAIASRINQRRADIQEMRKRLEHSLNATRATLKYCEDMSKCVEMEEHYANTVD